MRRNEAGSLFWQPGLTALPGPAERWRALREHVHADVCRNGFDAELNSFVQSYGAKQVDASLLLLPLVGFLPADDPRITGTVAAIERFLLRDCFVLRYNTESAVDGLPGNQGAFLACSVGGKDELLGRDNGSSNAADGYGVFQLRAMQRIVELIPATSPRTPQSAQFPCAA